MFLPFILLERYGWAGFAVFAVPNVLGCAAFGYVVRTRARSESMERDHGGAMAAFSSATLAFHVFFAGFAARCLLPGDVSTIGAFGVAVLAYVLAIALSCAPRHLWLPMAAAAYVISLAAFVRLGVQPLLDFSWAGEIGPRAAPWLIPVMLLGFLLCPYLDLTFHRALRQSPSHHAFAVFGVTFAVMIVLTCAYAPFVPSLLPTIVFVHLGAQLLFTSAAHAREIRECTVLRRRARMSLLLAPLLASPLVLLLASPDDLVVWLRGTDVYLRFIVIYGLAAPAYVLLVMTARRLQPPTGRALLVAGGLALLVSPCYEFGFFRGETWLLAIPPVVLAAAAAVIRSRTAAGVRS